MLILFFCNKLDLCFLLLFFIHFIEKKHIINAFSDVEPENIKLDTGVLYPVSSQSGKPQEMKAETVCQLKTKKLKL